MATPKPPVTFSGPDKAPRQIKSKHKSRSGCQACKLRRLKCDETKPSCRNCQKKGQECPGYTLRLQWSTKYERPREPARPEPTNFDELVSAVTQTIAPGTQRTSPKGEARPALKSETSSAGSSLAAVDMGSWRSVPSPIPVQTKRGRSPELVPRPMPSTQPLSSPYGSAQLDPVSALDLLADATHPDYTSSVDLTGANAFIDYDSSSMLGSTPVSGDSIWRNSRNNSPAPGNMESLAALATSGEVDEPETSLAGTPANISVRPARSMVRLGQIVPQVPRLARPLFDIPSFLIQHWFKSVCGSWSAFDSQTNPYRQLSASLWDSSMAVFYALQSMAAASLVEHLPHLKEVSRSAPRLAAQAIEYELQTFRATAKSPMNFPGGLVLSLFCMSSSNCWTDSRQFGLQFLKPGRAVLKFLDRAAGYLSARDRELLNFFNGCLIYEEMLRSIVSNNDTDLESLATWHVSSSQPISVAPHAWTGVSPDLLRLFGKTMFLCRRSRNRWRQSDTVADKILHETADYQEAALIEEVLLTTELPDLPPVEEDYAEDASLKRHLHDAAEAYRLSSLLQLHQTFPSLIARRLPGQTDASGFVPYSVWLLPLALRITNILRSIPPSSSMRCLQPLLCLCAGTGLRYDNVDPLPRGQNNPFAAQRPIPGLAFGPPGTAGAANDYGLSGLSSSVIGENDLEIASARRFLMERLGRLEQNLPPKPIQVEKELLKCIWATYDAETGGTCTTHWLDVMVKNGLESVFG